MSKKAKGVLVKEVPGNYELSGEEAELIARLTERGYIVILDRRDKELRGVKP